MWDNKQQEAWDDIKNIWKESSHSKEISIIMSQLSTELKDWSSPFEQNAIKNDTALIKGAISQFEKESIKKDLILIKRTTNRLEKNFIKWGIRFVTGIVKKIFSKGKD